MVSFKVGSSGQILGFADEVLDHFCRHRQQTLKVREAGGQLFAHFDENIVRIQKATGPRPADYRSRNSFVPNRSAERREIRRLFRIGLYYVGDWHTHPERNPSPSQTDLTSFRDMFLKSKHELAGFVMVIVGTAPVPNCLFVALCTGDSLHELTVAHI